jgi:dTDP-4-amino-4,6-dideoxygalactose transaminase
LSSPFLPLSLPYLDQREESAVREVLQQGRIGGGGEALTRVEPRLADRFGSPFALLTTSCTHALELLAMLHGLGPQDEILVPSYAHSSAATAFLRQGARIVFADCLPDAPHLDPHDVESRITQRTRALCAMHYAGIPAQLAALEQVARRHGLLLFEDAAQAFDARHAGRACGTIGDGGAISFHETKNVTCGEGGLLLLRDADLAERALCMREMGTDRASYRSGRAPGYTWLESGSSFLPSELLVSILEVQLDKADEILAARRARFDRYVKRLTPAADAGLLELPEEPEEPTSFRGNAHVFYIVLPDADACERCLRGLRARGIGAAPHFEALHETPLGRRLQGEGSAPLPNAARMAKRLLRLPLHPRLSEEDQDRVIAGLLPLLTDH